jgi:hypothetical protein
VISKYFQKCMWESGGAKKPGRVDEKGRHGECK